MLDSLGLGVSGAIGIGYTNNYSFCIIPECRQKRWCYFSRENVYGLIDFLRPSAIGYARPLLLVEYPFLQDLGSPRKEVFAAPCPEDIQTDTDCWKAFYYFIECKCSHAHPHTEYCGCSSWIEYKSLAADVYALGYRG